MHPGPDIGEINYLPSDKQGEQQAGKRARQQGQAQGLGVRLQAVLLYGAAHFAIPLVGVSNTDCSLLWLQLYFPDM